MEHQCQRVVVNPEGRGQCPARATWRGWAHAGRDVYVVEACDRHQSGLIDAESLEDDDVQLVDHGSPQSKLS
jgi:hypothetical protein